LSSQLENQYENKQLVGIKMLFRTAHRSFKVHKASESGTYHF